MYIVDKSELEQQIERLLSQHNRFEAKKNIRGATSWAIEERGDAFSRAIRKGASAFGTVAKRTYKAAAVGVGAVFFIPSAVITVKGWKDDEQMDEFYWQLGYLEAQMKVYDAPSVATMQTALRDFENNWGDRRDKELGQGRYKNDSGGGGWTAVDRAGEATSFAGEFEPAEFDFYGPM